MTDHRPGTVEAIFVAAKAGAPCVAHHSVLATPGLGLAGDRYAAGEGTFSDTPGDGRQLTLIAAEALESVAIEHGIALTGADARRNIVTRGVDLHGLLGARFRIGSIECVGVRECPPCKTLEGYTTPGVMKALAGRGGLRADILTEGTIAVGDEVVGIDSDIVERSA